jgi:hypothetical protein
MGLPACHEACIEHLRGGVPAERPRQCGGIERAAQPAAATADMRLALAFAALMGERREACAHGGFFAADLTELARAQDHGERDAFADARHAQHQLEAPCQIRLAAHRADEALQLGGAPLFRPRDVSHDAAPQTRVADGREPGLAADDTVLDLLDEGVMIGQHGKPRIGRQLVLRIFRDGAGGDQDGIDAVVFGAPQMQLGKRLDVQRRSTTTMKPAACKWRVTPRS